MKFIVRHVILLCGMLPVCAVYCQGLKVGEKIPALKIRNVINYSNSALNLSSMKGKNIIIEFWGTNCLSCIQAFPKLDSLQKKYATQLQIILVTKQTKKVIKDFFVKRKNVKMPSVPLVTDDTELAGLIPRRDGFYSVWIDTKGILRYVTDSYNVNEKKVNEFINGINPGIAQLPEDNEQAVYETAVNEYLDSTIEYFSFLGKCTNRLRLPSYVFMKKYGFITISRDCASVSELFIDAYSERGVNNINEANTIIELPDVSKVIRSEDVLQYKDWETNYSYSYELRVPLSMEKQVYEIMQDDLKRYFNLEMVIQTRKRECYVLKKLRDNENLKTKGGAPLNTLFNAGLLNVAKDSILYFRNKPFKEFSKTIKGMIEYELAIFFIDETGYTDNTDIILKESSLYPLNIETLNNEIKAYGMRIVKVKRKVPVFVLREMERTKMQLSP